MQDRSHDVTTSPVGNEHVDPRNRQEKGPDDSSGPLQSHLLNDGRKIIIIARLGMALLLFFMVSHWPQSLWKFVVYVTLFLLLGVCAMLPRRIVLTQAEVVFDYGFIVRRLHLSDVLSVRQLDRGLTLIRGTRGRLFLLTSHMKDFGLLVKRLMGLP